MDSLDGFTVGVTADRRADDQVTLLRRLGLQVVRGPAISTVMTTDDGALRAITARLIERPPDFVVANTGIGVRSWLAAAEAWGIDHELLSVLGAARIAARGPKAAGAVRSAGLPVWWRAPSEQLAEVATHLVAEGIQGARVAVQRHGAPDDRFVATLEHAGAEVVDVPVYRWSVPPESDAAARLIELVINGSIDAVTFTSGPAIQNLVSLARKMGAAAQLLDAFGNEVIVACVGPVSAGVALAEGITRSIVPEHWRLGALVTRLAEELRSTVRSYELAGVAVTLQGSLAVVDGEHVCLTAAERAVASLLGLHLGEEVMPADLEDQALRHAPIDGEAGAPIDGETGADIAASLRAKLGAAGAAMRTTPGGGLVLQGHLT